MRLILIAIVIVTVIISASGCQFNTLEDKMKEQQECYLSGRCNMEPQDEDKVAAYLTVKF